MSAVKRRPKESFPAPTGLDVEHLDDGVALLSFDLPHAELPDALTLTEQEVALSVFEGRSNREIAAARGVSVKTVGHQLESIYRKLGVSSRVELVLRLRGRAGRVPR